VAVAVKVRGVPTVWVAMELKVIVCFVELVELVSVTASTTTSRLLGNVKLFTVLELLRAKE
jgi:hypothetical protein